VGCSGSKRAAGSQTHRQGTSDRHSATACAARARSLARGAGHAAFSVLGPCAPCCTAPRQVSCARHGCAHGRIRAPTLGAPMQAPPPASAPRACSSAPVCPLPASSRPLPTYCPPQALEQFFHFTNTVTNSGAMHENKNRSRAHRAAPCPVRACVPRWLFAAFLASVLTPLASRARYHQLWCEYRVHLLDTYVFGSAGVTEGTDVRRFRSCFVSAREFAVRFAPSSSQCMRLHPCSAVLFCGRTPGAPFPCSTRALTMRGAQRRQVAVTKDKTQKGKVPFVKSSVCHSVPARQLAIPRR
jgi:hypothetical protein